MMWSLIFRAEPSRVLHQDPSAEALHGRLPAEVRLALQVSKQFKNPVPLRLRQGLGVRLSEFISTLNARPSTCCTTHGLQGQCLVCTSSVVSRTLHCSPVSCSAPPSGVQCDPFGRSPAKQFWQRRLPENGLVGKLTLCYQQMELLGIGMLPKWVGCICQYLAVARSTEKYSFFLQPIVEITLAYWQ